MGAVGRRAHGQAAGANQRRLDCGRLPPSAAAPASFHAARSRSTGEERPQRVIVSNVAGQRVERLLRAAFRQARGPTPEFVISRRSAAGLTTDYLEPWRLGVDRFVAAIGAHHLAQREPVCVVNVGTAVTLDLVDARGRHRGGAIVPGPQLMVDSLMRQTSGIRRRAGGGRSGARRLFAHSTRMALAQGALYAAAAVIDRSIEEAQRLLRRRPLLLMTGGGSSQIRPLLRTPCVSTPDLVLHGLAVWASLLHTAEL